MNATPPTPDTDLDSWLNQPDPAPALQQAVARPRRFTRATEPAQPPVPAPGAWSDLTNAAARCDKTLARLPEDGAGVDGARAMLAELAPVARAAADSLLTDPTLVSEPSDTGIWSIVDLFCEVVRQLCAILPGVFHAYGLERWPLAERWAEVEALHERAMQLGPRIPETVPRRDHATEAGCEAISLARLAVWHDGIAEAARTLRSAVAAAEDGLAHVTPRARELALYADQLDEYAVRLAGVHAEESARHRRPLGLPTT